WIRIEIPLKYQVRQKVRPNSDWMRLTSSNLKSRVSGVRQLKKDPKLVAKVDEIWDQLGIL
ncbi:hypothetical protein D5E79_24555, partial [Vibrio parahaemolyticus]